MDDAHCRALTREAFDRLDAEAQALKIRPLRNLALGMIRLVRGPNRELAVLP